eukprot:TRINITY_DN10490_c0_g1_i1.p1 TRINITY_DN10490_c0_g1~~TRINITY_DN10490_c0_g1_i1.p1  ORF type:complete len:705 (-),score=126.62 TRINITY_DN10490_c0_g1_i1:65-2179(-)
MGNIADSSRKVFERFDIGHTGDVNLEEIAKVTAVQADPKRPEASVIVSIANSPLVLFHFDASREGTLNRDEFDQLMKNVRQVEQKVKNVRSESGCVCCRKARPPAVVADAVVQQIVSESREHFATTMKDRKGRQMYKDWLFKLSDVAHNDVITLPELRLVLRAVARDGVRLDRLCFDTCDAEHLPEAIMNEYDYSRTGELSKTEFMQLADCIIQEYEFVQRFNLKHECIGPYRLSKLIGTGSFGAVLYAYNEQTCEHKAIKMVKKGRLSDQILLDTEVKAMGKLRHSNIVQLDNVIQTDDSVFIVMELCGGGCLHDVLPENTPLPEPQVRFYFRAIIDAVAYCHSQGVCHRDLRLENVLLDSNGEVKVADFGHAGMFEMEWDMFSTALVGSLYHISPEQIANKAYSGCKLDIWAAGITLYRLLVGHLPFYSKDLTMLFYMINKGKFTLPSTLSAEAVDLVRQLLSLDPAQRPTAAEVLQHPFLTAGPAIKMPILHTALTVTISAGQALDDAWRDICDAVRSQGIVVLDTVSASPLTLGAASVVGDDSEPRHSSVIPAVEPISRRHSTGSSGPPCLYAARCSDSKHNIKFWLRVLSVDASGRLVQVELEHKNGELWRCQRIASRIAFKLAPPVAQPVQEPRSSQLSGAMTVTGRAAAALAALARERVEATPSANAGRGVRVVRQHVRSKSTSAITHSHAKTLSSV